jgi:hypothetical protein
MAQAQISEMGETAMMYTCEGYVQMFVWGVKQHAGSIWLTDKALAIVAPVRISDAKCEDTESASLPKRN